MWERRPGEVWISFVAGPRWVRNLVSLKLNDLDKPLPKPTGEPLTIVAFGSSTTAPRGSLIIYPMIIEWELSDEGRNVVMINAGRGSDTTARAAARFERDVLAHEPDLVIIQLGINDSAIDVWRDVTVPRVPIDDYEANLEGFVTTLKERGAKVILMTPNPLRWTEKLKELYGRPPYDAEDPDGFSFLLRTYTERVRQIAARNDVPLVDTFTLFYEDEQHTVDELLLDGMHPNDAGHAIEADALLKLIREMFPVQE
jgi:lysophospholipase L1-like esterase